MDALTQLYSQNSTLRDEYFTAKNKGATSEVLDSINKKIDDNNSKLDKLLASGNFRLQNGTKYYPFD